MDWTLITVAAITAIPGILAAINSYRAHKTSLANSDKLEKVANKLNGNTEAL